MRIKVIIVVGYISCTETDVYVDLAFVLLLPWYTHLTSRMGRKVFFIRFPLECQFSD